MLLYKLTVTKSELTNKGGPECLVILTEEEIPKKIMSTRCVLQLHDYLQQSKIIDFLTFRLYKIA